MTGSGNWTWLIPGRVPTLIDAGVGEPRHLQALDQALGSAKLAQVVATHGHSDHVNGAPVIAARMPAATFMKMPWPERDLRLPIEWRAIGDGAVVAAGDTTLVAMHTPGHAPDHLCFWHEETRTVFAGDLVIKGTTVFIPGNAQGDMAAYIASLERIAALDPVRILPAHGPVIGQPVPWLRHYIRHRHEREAQVIEALRAGDATAGAIVARIYRGLPETLLPRAAESVTAHLLKLEREGRARLDDGAWNIIGP